MTKIICLFANIVLYLRSNIKTKTQMKFLSKDFYKEFYKQIDECEFEEDEQVELEIDYLGETLIIYGIARFETVEHCSMEAYGTWDDYREVYSYEREFDQIEITKIEKV